MAGIGALRWQQGATGAEAGAGWPAELVIRWFMHMRSNKPWPPEPETQTASPSTGARSTVTSNQEAMSPRDCMTTYTPDLARDGHHEIVSASISHARRRKKPHAFAQGSVCLAFAEFSTCRPCRRRREASPASDFGSGISATSASVVSIRAAIEPAFCRAVRVTLVGSMTPAFTRSTNSPVWAL